MPSELSFSRKFFYGVGELSATIPSTLLAFFLLFFLTNVAGLNPGLAGSILLMSKIWDGINDPMIGWLSDRTKSRLGRRYPWMLWGAIPLAVCFCLQWFVPSLGSQRGLFIYYVIVAFLVDSAFTAVVLPFSALAPELTQDYNERTSLITFKSVFSIGGSLASLIIAQVIFSIITDSEQKYLTLGVICSIIVLISVYLCVWGTYSPNTLSYSFKREISSPQPPLKSGEIDITLSNSNNDLKSNLSLWQQIRTALSNRAFLILIGLYLCSWLSVQVTASILPYYVVNWMGLPEHHATQMAIAVQGTALAMMFIWSRISQNFGKKSAYFIGVPLWIIADIGLFFLQPQQIGLMYVYGVMIGMGLATAYLVPGSMLPDVIELDQLQTGQRREGIFYGFMVQLQKFGVAIALFLIGQILNLSGFITNSSDPGMIKQPESALLAIRLIIAPIPILALICGLICVYFYPITREVHQEILLKLHQMTKKS